MLKGTPAANTVMGDATVTVSYTDGTTQEIAFQSSGDSIYLDLEHTDYISGSGTESWTQVASLNPGAEFRIISSIAAQAYDPTKPFEGSQLGARVLGKTTTVSTSASSVADSGSSGQSGAKPPVTSAAQQAPSNIHAIIISALSDPRKSSSLLTWL